jgi:methionyl-tRNA formyltransferase
MRLAFAGDRDISVQVLSFILRKGVKPLALFVPDRKKASHAEQLIAACPFLKPSRVFRGVQFREAQAMEALRRLELDYIIGVHFPYVVPEPVLLIPCAGCLNLHPAYLPFNRGWHTPSWAILEGTPIGATLHFMRKEVDAGDIVHQRRLAVLPSDTAHTLYRRVKALELRVFKEAWPRLVAGGPPRRPLHPEQGSMHRRRDLYADRVQRIDLDGWTKAGDLINRLRALTTNDIAESAYYDVDGKRYRIQVRIQEERKPDAQRGGYTRMARGKGRRDAH